MLGLKQAVSRVGIRQPPLIPLFRPLVHASPQLLQVQSIFPAAVRQYSSSPTTATISAIPPSSTITTMSATPPSSTTTTATTTHLISPDIPRILSFWFAAPADGSPPQARWFQPPPSFDAEILSEFGSLIDQARDTTDLDPWAATPTGSLALILLLDQFPRNVFRGTATSFASDAKAVAVASRAIAQGFDRQLPEIMHVLFMYMPLMHDESLVSQIACCALFEALLKRCQAGEAGTGDDLKHVSMSLPFSHKHRDVVARFGRFPGRNKALGRECTAEENQFLETNPFGL